MVDDVLLFLSYLVKAPALPVRPTWKPPPILILARSVSNISLVSSPSSVRSQSSYRPGRAKGSKGGTPTSVRSFNSNSGHRVSGIDNGSGSHSLRSCQSGASAGLGMAEEPNTEKTMPSSRDNMRVPSDTDVSAVPFPVEESALEDVDEP